MHSYKTSLYEKTIKQVNTQMNYIYYIKIPKNNIKNWLNFFDRFA
jgi:hypothetical protein